MAASNDAWIGQTGVSGWQRVVFMPNLEPAQDPDADPQYPSPKRFRFLTNGSVVTNAAVHWLNQQEMEGPGFVRPTDSTRDIANQLFPGEEVLHVQVFLGNDTAGKFIRGIQLVTTMDRKFAYGPVELGGETKEYVEQSGLIYPSHEFKEPLSSARILKGFELERTPENGGRLRAIRLIWGLSTVNSARNMALGPEVGPDVVYMALDLPTFGNPLHKRLSKIRTWTNTGHQIIGIRCQWKDEVTGEISEVGHGSTAQATERSVTLGQGDEIICVFTRTDKTNADYLGVQVQQADGKYVERDLGDASPDYYNVKDTLDNQGIGAPGTVLPEMVLFGFKLNYGQPKRLAPLWIAKPPNSYEIQVDRIIWDQGRMSVTEEAPGAKNSSGVTVNDTDEAVVATVEYEFTTTKSRRFQTDRSISQTTGVEVSASVTVSSSAGFVSGEATAGFRAFTEITGTFSQSNELAQESTTTTTFTEEVTVAKRTKVEHTSSFKKVECRKLTWTGRIIAIFPGGERCDFGAIGGTFSGTDSSRLETSHVATPL